MFNLKSLSFFQRNSLFGISGLALAFSIFTSMFFFLNTIAVNAETCMVNSIQGTCTLISTGCGGLSSGGQSTCAVDSACCYTPASGTTCDVKNCKSSCALATEQSDVACKSVCDSDEDYCVLKSSIDPASTPTTPQSVSISFSNPLKYGTVDEVLSAILMGLRGVIIALSLVFIVLGGVFYIVSMGDSGKLTTAKNMITAALIGLAIALLAPTFLKEIYDFLGGKGQGFTEPTEVTNALSAATVLLNVLNFLLSIVGVIAIIMLVIGGMAFFTAAGDTSKVTTAKKIITFALIGITVALASLVLVRQLANFFVT